MMITEGIKLLVENRDLPAGIAEAAMREIMTGNATSAQIASFATALRMKGELPDELAAMARVMREFSTHIHPMCSGRLVDTCGTGGGTVRTGKGDTHTTGLWGVRPSLPFPCRGTGRQH